MSQTISRHIKIDNWIFEVKMVRALRVDNYGEPYTAIANISLNGSSGYIDGIMQKNHHKISEDDVRIIENYCKNMDVSQINVEKNNEYLTIHSEEQGVAQLKLA